MIGRRILLALVLPIPVLIVAFAVLLGGSALAAAAGDPLGGRVLRWIAVGAVLLLVMDLLLLVLALGMNAVGGRGDDERRP